jgi:hypothetical protein
VPYPPYWAKTEASTATPNTPPSSRIALFAPEAWPSSCGRTEESTTFATGAKYSAMPMPEITNGSTKAEYAVVGEPTAASQARPVACSPSPTTISGLPPMRSESAPAIGATKIGIAVHGRIRRPACSGE